MKKAAITGHSRGIGHALKTLFLSNTFEVKGFSRSNGYDISRKTAIQQIIDETLDCNIFVNNAYYEYQQVELAELWHQTHKNNPYLIINISSVAVEIERFLPIEYQGKIPYVDHKRKLNSVSENINYSGSKAKAITVSLGVVDTDFPYHSKFFYDKMKKNNTLIPTDQTAKIIFDAVNSFQISHFISNLTVLNNDKYL